jgi:hypothetical protein
MTFHIGNQTGGVINNVAGDQRVSGGQHGTVVSTEAALRAVQQLRNGLGPAKLDASTAAEARERVDEIDSRIREAQPDRPRIAAALERLTRLLVAAGSLAAAGAGLLGPLQTLAGWLGTLGEPVLRLLAG